MDLYKDFVEDNMSQVLENKKKDPDTINELDRQLAYINKSITTLQSATMKNEYKTKENIKDRMNENKKLIRQLERIRDEKKQLEQKQKDIELEIQTLRLQNHKKNAEGNFQEKLYELYKRASTKDLEGQNQDMPLGQEKGPDGTKQPVKPKGRLYKGTPFLRGKTEDKMQIAKSEAQLEDNDQQILLLKLEKRSLQEQIIRLLDEKAADLGMTEEEKNNELAKLKVGLTSQAGIQQQQMMAEGAYYQMI